MFVSLWIVWIKKRIIIEIGIIKALNGEMTASFLERENEYFTFVLHA